MAPIDHLKKHKREGGYTFVTAPEHPGFSFMLAPGEDDSELLRVFEWFCEVEVAIPIAREIVAANPEKAAQARATPALVGWFVGQTMKRTYGKLRLATVAPCVADALGIGPESVSPDAA